jgi:GcrA cell cycle regulator
MQSTDWAPAHSEALREYLAKGMSYSEIADAINAKFKTAYSRSAAIGRATRIGLGGHARSEDRPRPSLSAKPPLLRRLRERYAAEFTRPVPIFERAETVKTALRRNRSAPSFPGRARTRRLPLSLRR